MMCDERTKLQWFIWSRTHFIWSSLKVIRTYMWMNFFLNIHKIASFHNIYSFSIFWVLYNMPLNGMPDPKIKLAEKISGKAKPLSEHNKKNWKWVKTKNDFKSYTIDDHLFQTISHFKPFDLECVSVAHTVKKAQLLT